MLFETHLLISYILYNYLSKEQGFKINKLAFMYGCIKPDINNEDIQCSHVLDESISSVNKYSEKLITNNVSIKAFSVSLGVICHFICDYFCIYHNDEYKLKGVFPHTLYEIKLHYKFLIFFIMGKVKFDNYIPSENNLMGIVIEMREKYILEKKSLIRDIKYALSVAAIISEFILYSSEIKLDKCNDLNSEICNLVD